MDNLIFKIICICIVSACFALTMRSAIPSFVPILLITSGIVCFFMLIPHIEDFVFLIHSISDMVYGIDDYVAACIKIVGIALLSEFASQMCADMGENYLSAKIDFAGKLVIVSLCAPEFLNLINTVIDMISDI